MTKAEETIPEQRDGSEVNVEESVDLPDEQEAKTFFGVVKERLLNVNDWKERAGALSAGFVLTDGHGQKLAGRPEEGMYFKIDIPAPGITTGEGDDWVQIEEVKEESAVDCEYLSIRVRPAPSPVNENKDTAHFYTDAATSNFIVRRDGKTVTAGVYGRNEKPNVAEADSFLDKIRNAVIGSGSLAGASHLQWKALVSGLIKK